MLYLSPTSSDTTCVFLKKVDFMSSFLFNILSCIVTDMIYPYLCILLLCGGISSIQSLRCVQLFATPCTAECQASLCITNSWSMLKLLSIESVMAFNHLILCCPLLLLPSIFPSIRVFSSESVLRIRWPKFWSFSFSISPSSEFRTDFL